MATVCSSASGLLIQIKGARGCVRLRGASFSAGRALVLLHLPQQLADPDLGAQQTNSPSAFPRAGAKPLYGPFPAIGRALQVALRDMQLNGCVCAPVGVSMHAEARR
jgi:hypothetical protein